jgi:glycosyltransferase involved in cell wall biosynthesis
VATIYTSTILDDVPIPRTNRSVASGLTVGYVGRLAAEKEPDLFLDVAERVAEHGMPVTAHVVGAGELASSIVRRVSRMRNDNLSVVLHGWLDDPRALSRIYERLDFLLVPSPREGSPKVLVEAIAHGCPVLIRATNDKIQEFVDAGAVVHVPTRDPEAWATQLDRLRDSDEYDRLCESGRTMASHFTLKALSTKIAAAYEQAGFGL